MWENKKNINRVWSCKKNKMSSVLFILISQRHNSGWEKERPGPYLLSHISVERLFISLSHLQHSDTVAVKDSLRAPSRHRLREKWHWKQGCKRTITKPFSHCLPLKRMLHIHTSLSRQNVLTLPLLNPVYATLICEWHQVKKNCF